MSREVKFRIWDKTSNRMLYQDDFERVELDTKNKMVTLIAEEESDKSHYVLDYEDGIEAEIMQYTGLKNNNDGTELYEGDILESPLWEGEPYEIVFKDQAFKARDIRKKIVHDSDLFFTLDDLLSGCAGDTFKVIGNIYENPELLEGER